MAKRIVRGVGEINDFPDDVLSHIISFLPFKEAVRTSILSKRWRYLFSFISNLNLKVNTGNVEEWKRFLNSVDRLMLHLDMPCMVRCRLRCGGDIFRNKLKCAGFLQRVSDWICALIRHKIQELDIKIQCGRHDWSIMPPIMFSSESLAVLKLNLHCIEKNMQKIPDRIWLPNLKTIHLEGVHFSNDGSVGKLFSSCPVLEDLVLNGCWFLGGSVKFSISNQNLKTLTLKGISAEGGGNIVRIMINAPSLVILIHEVSTRHSLEFVDVKSLSETLITSFLYESYTFLNATPDTFGWIPNVERLRISFSVVRELQRSNAPIPLFEKLTYVKIWFQESCYDFVGFDPVGLEYFLARCVVLETLVFEESEMLRRLRHTNKRHSLKEPQLAPLLHHLKTIEIRLLDIGHVIVLMKVIKFFLKSSKVLEVLKISSKQGRPEEQFEITRTIMNYPRASKKCRVSITCF